MTYDIGIKWLNEYRMIGPLGSVLNKKIRQGKHLSLKYKRY